MSSVLQTQLSASLLTAEHPLYEQTRRGWNRSIDHHPQSILVAQNTEDIIQAVRYAREAGLKVAVQLTGHGIQQPADGSLLIVTTPMTGVQIDPIARIARVEAGAHWQHVLDQAAPYGLAPLMGTSPHVGVVGYTLGGGIGWLARPHGLAADQVRWIDIVTSDGQLRRASPSEHSDLFWGLRGGGGSFGVVTAIEFGLVPVATIYGGMLSYPGEYARDALRFFRQWVKRMPDAMTSSIAIFKYPSLPALPEALRGTIQVVLRCAYAGDAATGAALVQPWLDWHAPINATIGEIPFAAVGTISNEPVEPRAVYGSNEMFDELSDTAIDLIMTYTTSNESPLTFSELRHAGGAIAHGDQNATAIGNRDAQFYFQVAGMAPTPEAYSAVEQYIGTYKRALQPYLRGSVYLNFLMGQEARQRIRDAYSPASYQRLCELKARYDPTGMFLTGYQFGAPLIAN